MDRAQLEQLALEKIGKMQSVPSSSMDRASLEKMALEKLSGMGQTPINNDEEASLGVVNRAKYSIEPIQSNRKALLEQEYGQDNVLQNSRGDLYVNIDGQFQPVNKEGFSTADIADFAGATPEIAGGAVGTVSGFLAGVPTTGGAASIPMAMGTGALGAGAGSLIRQGLSAAIGNPQVATAGERALETGMSAGFGGLASGAGVIVKPYLQQAKTGVTNFFKGAGKEALDTVGETTAKTVSNSDVALHGEMTPILKNADEIAGQYADNSGRDVVQQEAKKLSEISARQGIPEATYAQAAQGQALRAEAEVMDTPLIGGKVRKIVDSQLKKINENLEKITGKFIDVDSDKSEVGAAVRDYADSNLRMTKNVASKLYQEVEEKGSNAMIGKRTFYNKFRDTAGEMGLINPDGSRAKYAADTGLTRQEFNTLQGVLFDGMDALKSNPSKKIRFEAANALRKTVKASAEENKVNNKNVARLLSKFGKELDLTVEGTLNREHPELGEVFRNANKTWAKYKDNEEVLQSLFEEGSDSEKHIAHIMGDETRITELKRIIGDEHVKEIGKTYVKDILSKLGKSGIGTADTAMTAIRKNGTKIKAALGKEAYDNLVDNIHFLNRTGQPLNVSRASLYNIWGTNGQGVKGFSTKVIGGIKTLAESKGTTITKATKDKVVETTSRTLSGVEKLLKKSDPVSSSGNILTDNSQRALSSFPGRQARLSEAEKEKQERRNRIISGRKPKKD